MFMAAPKGAIQLFMEYSNIYQAVEQGQEGRVENEEKWWPVRPQDIYQRERASESQDLISCIFVQAKKTQVSQGTESSFDSSSPGESTEVAKSLPWGETPKAKGVV